MHDKKKRFDIDKDYRVQYSKSANGKWYYEEFWRISYLERRRAYSQKPGRTPDVYKK